MKFLKNKFVIVLIIAIIAGLILGVYLAGKNKATISPSVNDLTGTGTNKDIKDAGDVLKKLDELAK